MLTRLSLRLRAFLIFVRLAAAVMLATMAGRGLDTFGVALTAARKHGRLPKDLNGRRGRPVSSIRLGYREPLVTRRR